MRTSEENQGNAFPRSLTRLKPWCCFLWFCLDSEGSQAVSGLLSLVLVKIFTVWGTEMAFQALCVVWDRKQGIEFQVSSKEPNLIL